MLVVKSITPFCAFSAAAIASSGVSLNSGIFSELNTDNSSSVSPAASCSSLVKISGVSSSDTTSGFPEVNSPANMVWMGILVEHSASARIPANNFFFIHSPLLSLYMIFCILTLLSSFSEFDTYCGNHDCHSKGNDNHQHIAACALMQQNCAVHSRGVYWPALHDPHCPHKGQEQHRAHRTDRRQTVRRSWRQWYSCIRFFTNSILFSVSYMPPTSFPKNSVKSLSLI